MKKVEKVIAMIVVMFVVISISCVNSFAATIGQPLTSPEAGWQRIETSNNPLITYGAGLTDFSSDAHYSGSNVIYSYQWVAINSTINFSFNGTKLRIILSTWGSSATNNGLNNKVIIDGTEYSLFAVRGGTYQILSFEVTGLTQGRHNVLININDSTFGFDAIDIDDTGTLLDPNTPSAPTNLTALAGNAIVDLSWTAVTGATSYNVKRATTEGGPYTTITTTSAITYTDTTVTNGTTYYYVVTAADENGESANSNESSATPQAPMTTGKALIVITMINGAEKEYDLSMTEVNTFIDWYDGKATGTGKAYYIFEKTYNKGPFISRKDYIVFDKIRDFEVMQYE